MIQARFQFKFDAFQKSRKKAYNVYLFCHSIIMRTLMAMLHEVAV